MRMAHQMIISSPRSCGFEQFRNVWRTPFLCKHKRGHADFVLCAHVLAVRYERVLVCVRVRLFAKTRRQRKKHEHEQGEKIPPKQWKAEIQSLQAEYDSIGKEQTKTATELDCAEVISYNMKNLERELQNESRQQNRQQGKVKRREVEI